MSGFRYSVAERLVFCVRLNPMYAERASVHRARWTCQALIVPPVVGIGCVPEGCFGRLGLR